MQSEANLRTFWLFIQVSESFVCFEPLPVKSFMLSQEAGIFNASRRTSYQRTEQL